MENRTGSRGFTLIELLIVVAIVGVLVSAGIAGYSYAKVRGNEAAAIAALGAINQAQTAFAVTCGNQRYAPTLSSLGTPVPLTGQAYLSPDFTLADDVIKSGYLFTMEGTEVTEPVDTCTGVRPVEGYRATAEPLRPGLSGVRYFGTNTSRVIFWSDKPFDDMPERGDPPQGAEIR